MRAELEKGFEVGSMGLIRNRQTDLFFALNITATSTQSNDVCTTCRSRFQAVRYWQSSKGIVKFSVYCGTRLRYTTWEQG